MPPSRRKPGGRQETDVAGRSVARYSEGVNADTDHNPELDEPIFVDVSHLVTEDDTPVDNPFSEKQMRLLTHSLYASWQPGVPFVAMANVGLFFALNAPPLVPDTLVSVGVGFPDEIRLKEHRAYFTWLYGKSPDIVIEIVSNRLGGELDRKMAGYAKMNVPYYAVYDPDLLIQSVPLQCFELEHPGYKGAYRLMSSPLFERTELGLTEWDGAFEDMQGRWIRWVDKNGRLIPTGEERAKAATKRNGVLEAKLRALGVDPDSV